MNKGANLSAPSHATVVKFGVVFRRQKYFHESTYVSSSFGRTPFQHSARDLSRRGAVRAEDAQGTPTQSHISPSILVYDGVSILQGVFVVR